MILSDYTDTDFNFFIARIICFLFTAFCLVCVAYGAVNKNSEPFKISDKFDIGYISEPEEHGIVVVEDDKKILELENKIKDLERKLSKPAGKKQSFKNNQASQQNNELLDECISALVNLGEKKSIARKDALQYLKNNPQTQTVEQFISGIFKR